MYKNKGELRFISESEAQIRNSKSINSKIERGREMRNKKLWLAGVSAVAALSLVAGLPAANAAKKLDTITWMSPRGSLDVMDDYMLHVAIDQGYFKKLGINVKLIAGPSDGTAATKFVAQKQVDVSYPSPGILLSSIAAGVPVVSVFNMIPGQVFNFATPKGSALKKISDFKGAKICVGSPAWSAIVNPMLVEAGVDPKSVTIIDAGWPTWSQAIAAGKCDAGLGWDGLRAQWAATGINVDWIIGKETSKQPSNGYDIRASELKTAAGKDLYTRFLRGVAMGMEFAKDNPRAAGQITYNALPALGATLSPQLAVDSMREEQVGHMISRVDGKGWGYHYPNAWAAYLKVVADIGQTPRLLTPAETYSNALLAGANQFDHAKVAKDAKAFKLSPVFAKVSVK
jgi:NitT/TauT family transport system substrate-binding protein